MSKENNENKLTKQELEAIRTQEGAFAVVMGYLKNTRGKIAPSVFNKLIDKLQYPKQKKDDLVKLAKQIQEVEVLKSLYDKGFDRVIKLDDLPNVVEEKGSLKENEEFSVISNYLVDHEENNAKLREMRKLQREGAYMEILMRGLRKHLSEELKGMPRAKYLKTEKPEPKEGDKSLILTLTDWHIGYIKVSKDLGEYNFNILKDYLDSILNYTLDVINNLGIKDVRVYFLGDLIEHAYMRSSQSFDAEFPATEQAAKGTRLIIDFLTRLSKHTHVKFGMVSGNHDRHAGKKDEKIYNDTITYVTLDTLLLLQEEMGQFPNVTFIDNRDDSYSFIDKVAGKTIKAIHGDHEKKKDDVKITKHIKDEEIDYLFLGHIHTSRIVNEDYHRFHIYTGSTIGANNYSKELTLPTTQASQLITVLTEGSNTPMFIPLMLKEGKVD